MNNDIPQVDASTVMDEINQKKDIVVIDVRTPQEFSRGNIAGSLSIPVEELTSRIENVVPDKKKTIYVYCLSGSRSSVAVGEMVKMGYKHAYSMTSGLLAWRSKSYPLNVGVLK